MPRVQIVTDRYSFNIHGRRTNDEDLPKGVLPSSSNGNTPVWAQGAILRMV
jgi:hypothetical protein